MKTKLYNLKQVLAFVLAFTGLSLTGNATVYHFQSALSGAAEVPPNASPASGILSGFYDDATNTISYGIAFTNLQSNTVAGHFHAPAPIGSNASVVIGYTGFPTGVQQGLYTNSHVLTDAQETQLLAGLWYSNIHTTGFPGGEIRGQLLPVPLAGNVYTFINQYTGSQEVPPVTTTGLGLIMGIYDPATNTISYGIGFANLMFNTTAAHLHAPAMPGANASVVIPHAGFPLGVRSGIYLNSHVLTDPQETSLLAGLWYSNIHTTGHPGGEIRAQIILQAPPPPVCTAPTFLNTRPIVGDANCGLDDGQISIIPTSGTAPFMYSLDGGATYETSPYATGFTRFYLPAGNYQLRLKDANGCESAIVERTIETVGCPTCTPPTFLNTTPIVGHAYCGLNEGQIVLIPTSGTAPFMYSIDNGATYVEGPDAGYTFFNLAPGMYHLKIKDANGCESMHIMREVEARDCVTQNRAARSGNSTMVSPTSDNRMRAEVSAFPNPSRGQFRISLQQLNAPMAEIAVFDSKGTLVQKRIINTKENNFADFNLSGRSAGLYIIKVQTSSGVKTSRLVLQK